MHKGVNNLPKVIAQQCPSGSGAYQPPTNNYINVRSKADK